MCYQNLLRLILLVISAMTTAVSAVLAQDYPVKSVRIVVPTAPGGGTDLIGRVLAPISLVAQQPFLFAVHPSLPVKTVAQLVTLAKKNPGGISYGSGGAGSGPFMGAELFKQHAKVDILHVPYKGAGPAFTDLIGGQVQMMIATLSLGMPHASSGRVRALGVTSSKRLATTPKLPTVAESGLPGFEFSAWYGVLAPAGTPVAVLTRLHQAVTKVMAAPETRSKFEDGLIPLSSTPDEFSTYLRQEVIKWGNVVKASGVNAN